MSNFVQTQIAQRALLVYWAKLLSLQVKVTIMEISRETKAAVRPALWRAETLATNRAATAVVAALTPVCIDKFRQAADASANLAEMKKTTDSWDQSKFVKKGGWATMPGSTEPNSAVATACAESLGREKAADLHG